MDSFSFWDPPPASCFLPLSSASVSLKHRLQCMIFRVHLEAILWWKSHHFRTLHVPSRFLCTFPVGLSAFSSYVLPRVRTGGRG